MSAAHSPWAPDLYEKALAIGAMLMLAAATAAILRGYAAWAGVPAVVWLHLATIFAALILTPVMLLRPRGDRRHRELGYMWVGSMVLTALFSLFVKVISPGHFSLIHILSVAVLITVPRLARSAHRHNIRAHRRSVKAIVTSALLVAGFFTLSANRLLGGWLFG